MVSNRKFREATGEAKPSTSLGHRYEKMNRALYESLVRGAADLRTAVASGNITTSGPALRIAQNFDSLAENLKGETLGNA